MTEQPYLYENIIQLCPLSVPMMAVYFDSDEKGRPTQNVLRNTVIMACLVADKVHDYHHEDTQAEEVTKRLNSVKFIDAVSDGYFDFATDSSNFLGYEYGGKQDTWDDEIIKKQQEWDKHTHSGEKR